MGKKITAAAATVTKNQEDPDNVIAAKIVKVVRKNVLKARFVKDSEGRHPTMFPGQTFTHTWRLMNSGTSTWSENVTVSYVGGDAMKGSETPVVIPPVGPNQIFDATIEVSVVDPSELTEVEMNQMFPVASSASSPAVVDDDKKEEEEEEEEEDDDDNSCIVGALPVLNFETDDSDVSDVSDAEDKDEDEDKEMSSPSNEMTASMDDLADWDMVSDSMRALTASSSETKQEQPVVVDESSNTDAAVPLAPAMSNEAFTPPEEEEEEVIVAPAPAAAVAVLTDERVKKQLEKLVELGFNEGQAAMALVQCNGDLGDAVT